MSTLSSLTQKVSGVLPTISAGLDKFYQQATDLPAISSGIQSGIQKVGQTLKDTYIKDPKNGRVLPKSFAYSMGDMQRQNGEDFGGYRKRMESPEMIGKMLPAMMLTTGPQALSTGPQTVGDIQNASETGRGMDMLKQFNDLSKMNTPQSKQQMLDIGSKMLQDPAYKDYWSSIQSLVDILAPRVAPSSSEAAMNYAKELSFGE
jgi:hypothetical protein